MPAKSCGRRQISWPPPRHRTPRSGRTAFPATCRSCWCAWPRKKMWRWCANWCAPMTISAASILATDLVILNERPASYAQTPQQALDVLVSASDRPQDAALGRIVCVRADLIGPRAAACCAPRRGWSECPPRRPCPAACAHPADGCAARRAAAAPRPSLAPLRPLLHPELEFFNGFGGFAQEGREYVMPYNPEQATPAPWVNVIANAQMGFQVSSEGAGFAWSLNSQQNQLDALVQRSGGKSRRRSTLSQGPGQWDDLVAHPIPGRRDRRRLSRRPWSGLFPFRKRLRCDPHHSDPVHGAGRSGEGGGSVAAQ